MSYKSCFVPSCKNSLVKTPDKIFISVPKVKSIRDRWFNAIERTYISTLTTIYCCEDHFDLKNDMENYMRFSHMGGKIFIKKDVIPHLMLTDNLENVEPNDVSPILNNNMIMCFAPHCNHYSKKNTCQFFVFPKDPLEREKWIQLLRRGDKKPSKHSVVCSCHFVNGDRNNRPTIYERNKDKLMTKPGSSTSITPSIIHRHQFSKPANPKCTPTIYHRLTNFPHSTQQTTIRLIKGPKSSIRNSKKPIVIVKGYASNFKELSNKLIPEIKQEPPPKLEKPHEVFLPVFTETDHVTVKEEEEEESDHSYAEPNKPHEVFLPEIEIKENQEDMQIKEEIIETVYTEPEESSESTISVATEKRIYGQWNEETMQKAIESYRKNEYGFNECCRRYQIPKPTFKRHLQGAVKRPLTASKRNGNLPTFPQHIEMALVTHLASLESNHFAITITDVRRLAYEIAEKHALSHKFNRNTKLAGKKWFYTFIKRHPHLLLAHTNIPVQTTHLTKDTISLFSDILQDLVRINGIDANRIYNMGDIGFSTVHGKNIGKRWKKIDKGFNTTILCCASASGSFVPPMFIFKRKRLTPQLSVGLPIGSIVEVAEDGFITSALFVNWLEHFIYCVQSTLQEKIILLLDAHSTYTKNLEALELAQSNGVILLQVPGRTLQPLNVGMFDLMHFYYNQALDQWRLSNDCNITQYEIAPLCTSAYLQAATISNAVAAFKTTGCWPVNRFILNNAADTE